MTLWTSPKPKPGMQKVLIINFLNFLRDPWMIAATTVVVTVAVVPLVSFCVRRIKGWFGAFSGQYLALTGDLKDGLILVEDVKCRHIGDRLTGIIRGVATLEIDTHTGQPKETAENKGKYSFVGFVDERLLVISYRSIIRAVHSSGSITLKADNVGRALFGTWAGLIEEAVETAPCAWLRAIPPISSKKKRDVFISYACKYATTLQYAPDSSLYKIRVYKDTG